MPKHWMPQIRIFRDTRGQAMTEFCVAMPVLIIMFWAIWYISDVYIVKYKTLEAARYGTWLLARDNDLKEDKVKEFIAKRYFKNNSSKLTIHIPARPKDGGGSDANAEDYDSFGDEAKDKGQGGNEWVDKAIDFIGETFMGSSAASMQSLEVEYEVPLVFGALNISEFALENVKISSRHYVIGNTWNGCQAEVHDIFGMFKHLLEGLWDKITGAKDKGKKRGSTGKP